MRFHLLQFNWKSDCSSSTRSIQTETALFVGTIYPFSSNLQAACQNRLSNQGLLQPSREKFFLHLFLSRYEYRVELVYQGPNNGGLSTNRNIVREFASEFDAGECWGYNRFFRLDLLASEGYLRPESNSLILRWVVHRITILRRKAFFLLNNLYWFYRFHVRPPTYFQKCRDLQRYLTSLLQKHTRYLNIIKDFTEVVDPPPITLINT